MGVKRTKVDTFVLVKLFLQLPRAKATEENPFKSMAYHLIEVKMFSSVGNEPNLANMTSRLYSRSCVAPLKKVLGVSRLPKSLGKRQGMRDNNVKARRLLCRLSQLARLDQTLISWQAQP